MKYDFETMLDRTNLDSIAVETIPVPDAEVQEGFSRIPMWVADMNFATVPTVPKRIIERASHPAYGYFNPRAEYFDKIIEWQRRRNGVEGLTAEEIGYENGVLGCLGAALQTLTAPGEAVLFHAPTYVGFTGTMANTGRKMVLSDLVRDENGIWRMDYEDMDKKLKENNIHLAVLCTPHNPTGRVWEREELEKAMEVYRKNDCYVVSDEIWSDLILGDNKHIPTQSVSEDAKNRTIAIYAPSKTFNLAGLIGSYHIIYNKYLRERIRRMEVSSMYNHMNVLSMYALMGAYEEEGYEWLDELRQVLTENIEFGCSFIWENFPGVKVSKPQGTYMLYLDCQEWCEAHQVDLDTILKRGVGVGVIWQDGRPFNFPCSIRMNLAVPNAYVREAFQRLKEYVFI